MSTVLEQARSKVKFDTKELTYIMWDGKEGYERFMNFQSLVENDPILKYDPRSLGISRPDLYEMYAKKSKRILELASIKDIKEYASLIFPEALASSLNYEMFVPTIQNLGTPEQQQLFMEPALRYQILGCYAQTELAHGSDMNKIETTATYDKTTQEFVVHTPSLQATKWWGSDMGLTATHAVAQAQLVVDGKKYGVQNFIVPIRDVKTHLPLPGILVGDIGAKFGFNSKDNGYLRFDQVRIPRVNMLSKYNQVAADGTFTKTGDDKIWHATMQLQRQHFLDCSWKALGQSLTIIVRYSLQRTQFQDKSGQEIPIFNYQLQQHKIVPLIAEMYGNMFGSKRVLLRAKENIRRIQEQNDFSQMMEIHVILSASKAFYTWNTFFGMERLRQCAGGHGYSLYSGLPQLVNEFAPCVAAEGDNTVLSLSVGKLLLMFLQKSFSTGKAPNESCDYLEDIFNYLSNVKPLIQKKEDFLNVNNLREILRYNVAFNVANAGQQLQALMGEKELTFRESTDKHLGILLNEITHTHSNYWTMKTFVEELSKINNVELQKALQPVCLLYGLLKIIETEGQLFEYGVLKGEQFKWAKEMRDDLIQQISEYAIGLVEPLGYTDSNLRTAIGKKDGQIYETLFNWASELNPVNDPQFQDELFQKTKKNRGMVVPKL